VKQYLNAAREVLEHGTHRENRTGVDTLSTFNINYEVNLRDGFPLLTTKEINWKNIVIENLWFLSGSTDISFLHKHGCHFWDPWADKNRRVPSAYGNFWRNFPVQGSGKSNGAGTADQIAWVLKELKQNPMSRRLLVSAWAPGNALQSALPPCHALWILNVQTDAGGEPMLCLHLTQRSCDMALGVPYNIAGYAFLLHLFSRLSGLRPGIFAHTLVDAHIYIAKADGAMAEYDHRPGLQEQLKREPRKPPQLEIHPGIRTLDDVLALLDAGTEEILSCFPIKDYDPHPPIKFKVAV